MSGWRVLLSHLNISRPPVRLLADYLQRVQPEIDPRRAKGLAEKLRRGQAIRQEDLGATTESDVAELLGHLDHVRRDYAEATASLEAGKRDVDRLRQTIPAAERERLKALRELGNGKALAPADQTLALLRTAEAIRTWAAMSRQAKLAWFTRVEAAILERDKRRSPEDAAWMTPTYRRLYLSARRTVANETDYEILGVELEADEATIKKAYRQAAMQHHPDKQGDSRTFQKIHAAYQRLLNGT